MNDLIETVLLPLSDGDKEEYRKAFGTLVPGELPVVLFDDIKHELEYREQLIYRPSFHSGQRKLFLSELQFLTDAPRDATVIYAGAAPWSHGAYLAKLLPHMKFLLVDPREFSIHGIESIEVRTIDGFKRARTKVCYLRGLFTRELAEEIRTKLKNIYFISDIRTVQSGGSPTTLDIIWNLSQQFNWLTIMKPLRSMFKFRHPFYNEPDSHFLTECGRSPFKEDFEFSLSHGIDFVENFKTRTLVYPSGEIRLQAWAPTASTETRLVIDKKYKLKDYGNHLEYQNRFYFHNTVSRPFGLYKNPNKIARMSFCECHDCALENEIWTRFGSNDVRKNVRELGAATRSLGWHGIPDLRRAKNEATKYNFSLGIGSKSRT
jgi:hypothetical protein